MYYTIVKKKKIKKKKNLKKKKSVARGPKYVDRRLLACRTTSNIYGLYGIDAHTHASYPSYPHP